MTGPGAPAEACATRRERALVAARFAFGREAFADVTLRRIASEAGIDPGLLVRDFGSKLALFEAVISSLHPPGAGPDGAPEGTLAGTLGERVQRLAVAAFGAGGDLGLSLEIQARNAALSAARPVLARRAREEQRVLAAAMSGPGRQVRASLAHAIALGVVIQRLLETDPSTQARTPGFAGLNGLLMTVVAD